MKTYHLLLPLLACAVPMNVSAGNNYLVEEATHEALAAAIEKCTSTNANDPDMVTFCIKDENKIVLTSTIALGKKAIIIDGFNNATKNYIVLDGGNTVGQILQNSAEANIELKNIKITGCINTPIIITGGSNTNFFLNQCDFYDNNVGSNNGGAVRSNGANLKVYNCNFSNNICNGTYGGGAICFYNSGTNSAILEVEGSSFINNKSLKEGGSFPYPGGGAICIFPSAETSKNTKASIKNTTFYGNSAYRGGAVYVKSASKAEALNVEFINNTIAANSAVNNGGGLCFVGKANTTVNIALINNLITNNGLDVDVNDFGWYNLEERVFITTAYNNIVTESSAFYNTFVNVEAPNGNQQIQKMTDIYKYVQTATVASATLDVPVLDGGFYKVAPLCVGSKASGAGIATLAGYTIPTKDAAGNERPETPAVGAMEISNNLPTAVEGISSSEMKLNKMGNQLVVTGIESGVVNVYNLLGELVLSSSIDDTKTVSIESLSNGIYIANVESVSFKFIK